MKHPLVGEIMTVDVVSVDADTPYKQIAELLASHHISAVPVLDKERRVLGVVSEADLMHKIEFAGEAAQPSMFAGKRRRVAREKSDAVLAEDLMTAPAVTVGAAQSLGAAARLMDGGRVKRLPVIDERGRLVGIISRADVLRVFLRGDESIRAEVVDEIMKRTLWMRPDALDALDVRVERGIVVLTGTVDRRSTIPLVLRLVEGVPGVIDVVSHLTYHFDDTRAPQRRPMAHY